MRAGAQCTVGTLTSSHQSSNSEFQVLTLELNTLSGSLSPTPAHTIPPPPFFVTTTFSNPFKIDISSARCLVCQKEIFSKLIRKTKWWVKNKNKLNVNNLLLIYIIISKHKICIRFTYDSNIRLFHKSVCIPSTNISRFTTYATVKVKEQLFVWVGNTLIKHK